MDTNTDSANLVKIQAENVNVFYGAKQALNNVSIAIQDRSVTAFIGPSGCGKSTFLRCFNRMNDVIPNCRVEGSIIMGDVDVNSPQIDPVLLRARIGMVFQKPNPFPKTIFENVAYGPRIHGLAQTKTELQDMVEDSLKKAGLWGEVADRLNDQATGLSGGQQQRLCIARAIAVGPDVLLMDEPCSALDPIATSVIEELISELQQRFTILIVTHSMQQAARVSQKKLLISTLEHWSNMVIRKTCLHVRKMNRPKLTSLAKLVRKKDGYAKTYQLGL